MPRLRRARDRNDVAVAREQPVQGDLALARLTRLADLAQGALQVIELAGLGRVGLGGQAAGGEREVGDQGHVELAAGVEHAVRLGLTVQQAVVDLVGRERDVRLRQVVGHPPHLFGAEVADADGLGLAGLHRLREPVSEGRHLGEREGEVHIVQVDCGQAQALEGRIKRGNEMPLRGARHEGRELGRNDRAASVLADAVADQPLGLAEARRSRPCRRSQRPRRAGSCRFPAPPRRWRPAASGSCRRPERRRRSLPARAAGSGLVARDPCRSPSVHRPTSRVVTPPGLSIPSHG